METACPSPPKFVPTRPNAVGDGIPGPVTSMCTWMSIPPPPPLAPSPPRLMTRGPAAAPAVCPSPTSFDVVAPVPPAEPANAAASKADVRSSLSELRPRDRPRGPRAGPFSTEGVSFTAALTKSLMSGSAIHQFGPEGLRAAPMDAESSAEPSTPSTFRPGGGGISPIVAASSEGASSSLSATAPPTPPPSSRAISSSSSPFATPPSGEIVITASSMPSPRSRKSTEALPTPDLF
mmetsp:Transcript_14231/g.30901  ORF Transcript_14231/g.30901 Transcript_14231/m.30901 type:complete len:235 (-) Transcript_14231:1625-2329(-)